MQSLAVKYRPKKFEDVSGQSSIKTILQQQLESREWKHAYLFCGGAGTGKTTCARIFANELNKGEGNPIELDAASNNGVDDIREIIQQSKTKSLDSEYKVFILDEVHALSNSAWQAMLKIIEEPPAKSIFLFCTTDPQKIPKTILSRVQRYDFQRISQQGIVDRLYYILDSEGYNDIDKVVQIEPLNYIAKLADGGMRDAVTMMDKCLSFSTELTLENVVKALGTVNYDIMMKLTDTLLLESKEVIEIIEGIHNDGKDLKQFMKQYLQFLIDVNKYLIGCEWEYITIPKLPEYEEWLKDIENENRDDDIKDLLKTVIELNSEIKYSATVKYDIEAKLMVW